MRCEPTAIFTKRLQGGNLDDEPKPEKTSDAYREKTPGRLSFERKRGTG
jgi:hypothetical protein